MPRFPSSVPIFDAWVAAFNGALAAKLDDLEATLGVRIIQVDLGGLFNDLVTQPEKFGLKNATLPACPDCGTGTPSPGAEDSIVHQPHKYVFWDFVHPSARTHKILGKDLANSVKQQLGILDD